MLKNSTYDFLKDVALVYLPAITIFFFTVATVWHIPYAEEIKVTMVAFDTLLGACLKLSSIEYQEQKQKELEEAKRLNGQGDE